MTDVFRGSKAALDRYEKLAHKALGVAYPRVVKSKCGGPVVTVLRHATRDDKAGYAVVTPLVEAALAKEKAKRERLGVDEVTELDGFVALKEPEPVAAPEPITVEAELGR